MIKLKKEQEQKNARSQKRYAIAAIVVEVLVALVFFMVAQDNKEWGNCTFCCSRSGCCGI